MGSVQERDKSNFFLFMGFWLFKIEKKNTIISVQDRDKSYHRYRIGMAKASIADDLKVNSDKYLLIVTDK